MLLFTGFPATSGAAIVRDRPAVAGSPLPPEAGSTLVKVGSMVREIKGRGLSQTEAAHLLGLRKPNVVV
jgi:hypothetical protein